MKLLAPLLALIVAVGVAVYLLGQRTGPALATQPDAVTTERPTLEDDVVLAAPEDAPAEVRTEEAPVVDGKSGSRRTDEKGHTTFVTEPGTYIVTLPTIEGFHPLEPREIDILEGEVVELVVQLERKN